MDRNDRWCRQWKTDLSPAGTIDFVRLSLEISGGTCVIRVDYNLLASSAATSVVVTFIVASRTKAAGEVTLVSVRAVVWAEICSAVKRAFANKRTELGWANVIASRGVNLCLAHAFYLKCTAGSLLLFDGRHHIFRGQTKAISSLI
jgi:hypothetical protein